MSRWQLAAVLALGVLGSAQRKVVPIDHSRTDPALAELRDGLLTIARARDAQRLGAWLAPTIKQGFAAPEPRDQFLRTIARGDPDFWCHLRDALEGGLNKVDQQTVYAPAIHWQVGGESDLAINRPGVSLYRSPSTTSPVVATLAYDLVRPAREELINIKIPLIQIDGCSYYWYEIVTASGKRGWVPQKYVTGQLGTSFVFKQFGKKWLLTWIGGGD